MDLTVSSASNGQSPQPTLSLQAALAEFEISLDDDQKRQFQMQSNKLDTPAILAFIKRLDATKQGTAGRSIAVRLMTFLSALQQFTGIVDTFVSSNPTIAALVWGGVRTALLAANNIGSYFEKVTDMIVNIGRFYPSYRDFGQLYPDCIELQEAICSYYAAIIRMCIKVIKVSQQSSVSRALNSLLSPFESDFSGDINESQNAAKSVELQCSLAAAKAARMQEKLAEVDRLQNKQSRHSDRLFRSSVKNHHNEEREARQLRLRRDVSKLRATTRENLSTINSSQALKRVLQQRVLQTAEWFQQDNSFKAWHTNNSGAILWCTGKMGTGKTVLVSSIVEYLHLSLAPSEIISYHFCSADHTVSIQARQILGSIARQVLDPQIQHANIEELSTLNNAISDVDSDEIVEVLSARMTNSKSYKIVLDGLDECETIEIEAVIRGLARLCHNHPRNLKIIIASRPDIEKQLRLSLAIDHRVLLTRPNTQSDIAVYTSAILYQCLEDEKLSLIDPSLIVKIYDTLVKDADGMFLWVHLFIADLCELHTDYDIMTALKSPSPSIAQLVERKIDRIQSNDRTKTIMKLLQYCGVIRRPLRKYEFQVLLSLEIGQKDIDTAQLLHEIEPLVAKTNGLMYIDEEEETVHYVHHSFRSYLFQNLEQQQNGFQEEQVDLHLGFLCMIYLNFSVFKGIMVKTSSQMTTGIPAINLGVMSVAYPLKTTAKIAQKLLRTRAGLQQVRGTDLAKRAQELTGQTTRPVSDLVLRHHFLEYARSNWLDHLTHMYLSNDTKMWHLFHSFVSGNNEVVDTPWLMKPTKQSQVMDKSKQRNHISDWALSNKKSALLVHEIKYRTSFLSVHQQRIIMRDSEPELLYALMDIIAKHDPLTEINKEILSVGLVSAAYRNKTKCIDLYVQLGLDVDARDTVRYGPTALQAAAGAGHLQVVERLLASGADVNASVGKVGGRTALQAAAERGHLDIVERLLASGADVNAPAAGGYGRTALQAAAERGHLDVVERLLASGADVNSSAAAGRGRTALQAAARGGHLDVVERLLASGADVNTSAARGYGRTVLQAAAEEGHLDVVERLLASGADVNTSAAIDGGRTALQAAAGRGHLDIVERLLASGADVNALAGEYGGLTALQAAVSGGHFEVVERLRRVGAQK